MATGGDDARDPLTSLPAGLRAVSIVVPIYNSAEILPHFVSALESFIRTSGLEAELILVNDGSRDGSWTAVQREAESRPWIRAFDLMKNFGQHNALLCGVRAARFDTIVTMDDDLQHPPEEVPKLLAKLAEGYDVVYGCPEREQHGLLRDLASRLTKFALKSAMGVETARDVGAFRAFRTIVRSTFADYRGTFVSLDVLLTWGTTRFASVRVRHGPRYSGVSNYTFRRLVTHAINMMTGFSIVPLQLASLTGFAFTLFGVLVLLYVVGRFILEGSKAPGFAFLASIVAIFSGAQLFALGIIGEYLARIHFRTMDRPCYVVREAVGGPGAEEERRT